MNCQAVLSCHQLPLPCFVTYLISFFFPLKIAFPPFQSEDKQVVHFPIYECDFNHNCFYMNDKSFCREGELVFKSLFCTTFWANESLPVFIQLICPTTSTQIPLLSRRPQVPFLVLFSHIAGYWCLAVLAQICRGTLWEAEQPGWSSGCWWDRQMLRNNIFPWASERVKGLCHPFPGHLAWGSPVCAAGCTPVHLHLSGPLRGAQVNLSVPAPGFPLCTSSISFLGLIFHHS